MPAVVATASAVLLVLSIALAPGGTTSAAYTDSRDVAGNQASAAVWQPNPPEACGDPSDYSRVVYLTDGDDVYAAGNGKEIVFGLGGNDVISGGNGKDCIIGGDGNDVISGGNGKDVLLGGPGNDTIDGGNGRDTIDGGTGTDACSGGHAPDVINC
jgi:Ca2+-binding RTX toxin-like protein